MGIEPALAQAKDFSELFMKREHLTSLLLMQAVTLLLFTSFAWGPWLAYGAGQVFHLQTESSFFLQLGEFDRWFVAPQVRLLLFFSETFEKSWPGPLAGMLTDNHRALFGIFYGLIGFPVGWVVFRIHDGWPLRWAWLGVGFLAWGFFFQAFTFTFFHAVDSTQRLLGSTSLYM